MMRTHAQKRPRARRAATRIVTFAPVRPERLITCVAIQTHIRPRAISAGEQTYVTPGVTLMFPATIERHAAIQN